MTEAPMVTLCDECDRVHPATRGPDRPWNWRCLAAPRRPGFGYVSRNYSPDPPYARCQEKNLYGLCADFTPLRQPQEAVSHD